MRNFASGLVLGLLVLPVVALAAGFFGLFSTQATIEPPRWEKALAQRAFKASVARHAPRLENPIAPTEENLRAGLLSFRNNCAGCHGDSNQRSDWGSRNFYPRVPQFGFEHPQNLTGRCFGLLSRACVIQGWEHGRDKFRTKKSGRS